MLGQSLSRILQGTLSCSLSLSLSTQIDSVVACSKVSLPSIDLLPPPFAVCSCILRVSASILRLLRLAFRVSQKQTRGLSRSRCPSFGWPLSSSFNMQPLGIRSKCLTHSSWALLIRLSTLKFKAFASSTRQSQLSSQTWTGTLKQMLSKLQNPAAVPVASLYLLLSQTLCGARYLFIYFCGLVVLPLFLFFSLSQVAVRHRFLHFHAKREVLPPRHVTVLTLHRAQLHARLQRSATT